MWSDEQMSPTPLSEPAGGGRAAAGAESTGDTEAGQQGHRRARGAMGNLCSLSRRPGCGERGTCHTIRASEPELCLKPVTSLAPCN